MPNYNRVILMGNITRDPETKTLPSGSSLTKLGLAVNRTWKNQHGEKQEETSFIDCTAFGKQAEVIVQHFYKGDPIFIEGRLKMDQWQDKQSGQTRSKLGVIIEKFEFIKPRGESQPERPAPDAQPLYPPPLDPAPRVGLAPDEDIPF